MCKVRPRNRLFGLPSGFILRSCGPKDVKFASGNSRMSSAIALLSIVKSSIIIYHSSPIFFLFIYYFCLYLVSAESSIFYCLRSAVHLALPYQFCIGIFGENIFRLAGHKESAAICSCRPFSLVYGQLLAWSCHISCIIVAPVNI